MNSSLRKSPPPPFIDTRTDGVHAQGLAEVVFSQNRGGQWSSTVGSTLWGMAPGVAVILGIVLGLARIAPASWRLQRAAWWRSEGPAGQGLALVKAGVASKSRAHAVRGFHGRECMKELAE